MTIVPIPGPSAALAALVGSGLPAHRFSFEGFLPEKAKERRERLKRLAADERTLIFFIAPSTAADYAAEILEILGERKACLARELTKLHEEFVRAQLSTIVSNLKRSVPRGELVLTVGGAKESDHLQSEDEVAAALKDMLAGGARLKEACRRLSDQTGWAQSRLYRLGLDIKAGETGQP